MDFDRIVEWEKMKFDTAVDETDDIMPFHLSDNSQKMDFMFLIVFIQRYLSGLFYPFFPVLFTDYSYIVPTGTMVIHPVRMNGMVIGVPQTFDYFKQIQNRITGFVCSHCKISKARLEELMMETGVLTKDVGTILVGQEAVNEGIINEVGGIKEAMQHLHEMIGDN